MTRINVGIEPWELPGRLLLAEHREITRIPNAVSSGRADLTIPIPEEFTLGEGHVRFFYDKMRYLEIRYEQLLHECLRRGYNVAHKREAFNFLEPEGVWNDYAPTERDRQLIVDRIHSKGFKLRSENELHATR